MKNLLLLCVLIFTFINTGFAQSKKKPPPIWIVRTVDGSELVGEILMEDRTVLRLKNEVLGTIELPQNSIIWVRKVKQKRYREEGEERIVSKDASHTHYFVSQSAYNLKKGGGYFRNTMGIHNQATFAMGNRFSVGLNVLPLFLIGNSTPIWISPKFTFPIQEERINVAIGAYAGGVIEDYALFVLPYGAVTFGSRERNWTIGLGYGETNLSQEIPIKKIPLISFSGVHKLGKNGYIITENYLGNVAADVQGILSGGVRWVSRRYSLDLAAFAPILQEEDLLVIPWISFTIPFGASRD